jgi:hypothetical protein
MYCAHCFIKTKDETKCPKCGTSLKEQLTPEEKTALVQALHKKETHYRNWNDRGMCALVLGAIFLVIGAVFFSLAYKLDLTNQADNTRYLNTNCMEFWVAVVSLGGGGAAFLYGLVQVIIDARHLRVLKHDIAEINDTLSAKTTPTGLWIVAFTKNTQVKIANARAVHKIQKEREKAKKDGAKPEGK